MTRRDVLRWAAVGAAIAASAGLAGGQANRRRIEVKAQKFEFTPKEIHLKKGEPVTFVLRAEDFPHGFSLPDFKVRRDFVPGMTVEFDFAADKAGKFHFLCDNFCGEGHDTMSGWLIVSAG